VSARTQYLLFWYIAETLPAEVETVISARTETSTTSPSPYREPPLYPSNLRLIDRVRAEEDDYVPPKHEGTGVDDEELLYRSSLLGINDAIAKLENSVMAAVVKEGWEAVQERIQQEISLEGEHAGLT
jgi:hypothetical protein